MISMIISIGSGLLALYLLLKGKANKALVENNQATKELNQTDTTLAKNEGLLQAEELKRQNNEVPDASKEELVDFVNKRLPPL